MMKKCPTCASPAPQLHPAMQFEGEVQPCGDDFHKQVTHRNTQAMIAQAQSLISGEAMTDKRDTPPAETGRTDICPHGTIPSKSCHTCANEPAETKVGPQLGVDLAIGKDRTAYWCSHCKQEVTAQHDCLAEPATPVSPEQFYAEKYKGNREGRVSPEPPSKDKFWCPRCNLIHEVESPCPRESQPVSARTEPWMEKAAKHIATVWGYRKVSPADENAFLQIIQGEYVAAQTKEDVNAKSNESKGLDGAGHQLSASSTSAYVEQLRFERDLLQKEVDRLSAQTTPAKCRICGHAEDHTIHVDENHPSCHKFIAAGSAHTGGGTDKEK